MISPYVCTRQPGEEVRCRYILYMHTRGFYEACDRRKGTRMRALRRIIGAMHVTTLSTVSSTLRSLPLLSSLDSRSAVIFLELSHLWRGDVGGGTGHHSSSTVPDRSGPLADTGGRVTTRAGGWGGAQKVSMLREKKNTSSACGWLRLAVATSLLSRRLLLRGYGARRSRSRWHAKEKG